MSLVSIITPAYNCARFIGETIDSILAQTEANLELIVIDDGSTDETLKIAREKAARDARIKVIAREHSGKPAVARNAGIRQATGDFVTFLDGDDLYAPDRINLVGAVFRKFPNLDLVFHDVRFLDEHSRPQGKTFLVQGDYLRRAMSHLEDQGDNTYLCKHSFFAFMSTEIAGIHTSAVTVRTTALWRQPEWFSEDLTLMEDYDLWFRLVQNGSCAFLNAPLSGYRRYGSSISSRTEQFALDQYTAHQRNFERAKRFLSRGERNLYRRKLASMQGSLGYRHELEGNPKAARQAYLRSLAISPQARVMAGLVKTFLPVRLLRWLRHFRKGNT
jgi:glycosyltransferase involved in cell wall biosynthesis